VKVITRFSFCLSFLFIATAPWLVYGGDRPVDERPNSARAWLERFQESRGPEQVERITQTYDVGPEGALDLQNISGGVRVTAGRGNDIRIEAVKRVRHRDAATAKKFLESLRVEITRVGNRVEVRALYPRNGRGFSGGVDFTIVVPAEGTVALKTISGDVGVTGVRGEVRAETVSGNVDVTSTPNLAIAKTVSGDVTARDISSSAALELTAVSGTVTATGVKARTLEASTVSGDLHLGDVQVERLLAKSVSGSIEFSATIVRGGRYDFNSHSGDVRIALSNPPGFELDASTFSGSIRSDFPVTLRSPAAADSSRRRGGSIRGTYGDASAILAVRSFSGTVVITKQ
jgi:hypothetical protein